MFKRGVHDGGVLDLHHHQVDNIDRVGSSKMGCCRVNRRSIVVSGAGVFLRREFVKRFRALSCTKRCPK